MSDLYNVLLKSQNIKTGIAAPLIFSVEGLRKVIVASHELQEPVIVRVDPKYIDIDDVSFWRQEYCHNYPLAKCFIAVENIGGFDQAAATIMKEVDCISLSEDVKDENEIARIHEICKMASILLERTADLNEEADNADIVRFKGFELTDECVEKVKEKTAENKVFYAVNDFPMNKGDAPKVKELGLNKFDIFETASDRTMEKLDEMVKADDNYTDRFYMIRTVDTLLRNYTAAIKEKMYYFGQFVLR